MSKFDFLLEHIFKTTRNHIEKTPIDQINVSDRLAKGWNVVSKNNNDESLVIDDCRITVNKKTLKSNSERDDSRSSLTIYGRIEQSNISQEEFDDLLLRGYQEVVHDPDVNDELVMVGSGSNVTSMFLQKHGLGKGALTNSGGVAKSVILIQQDKKVRMFAKHARPVGVGEFNRIKRKYNSAMLKYMREEDR